MKGFITWMGLSLVLLLGTSFAQDSAKQDMKDAGHETKQAAKDAGHATKKTAKKTGHTIKRGTKKATHKAAHKSEEGAQNVEDKPRPQEISACRVKGAETRPLVPGAKRSRPALPSRALRVPQSFTPGQPISNHRLCSGIST